MILLDTNVVSEPSAAKPDAAVLRWFGRQNHGELFLSVVTVAELKLGVELLPSGQKKRELAVKLELLMHRFYQNRILPVNLEIATKAGEIFATTKRLRGEAQMADSLIAATALVHGFSIATRNVKDFQHQGLRLINPWVV